jgi:hypothetical protein
MADKATANIAKAAGAVAVVSSAVSSAAGIVDSVTSALNSVGTAAGALFSSFGVGLPASPYQLPLVNSLSQYSSYNYIVSMACLSAEEYNYPDSSYMAGKVPSPLIFKSGHVDPNNRVGTTAGVFEFYCSDLELRSQYGFEKGTGNTNTTSIEFSIVEPYSMGMFMQVVQIAAREKGYKNFNEAPFLLMIEFKGIDAIGSPKTVPNTKKYIPFNFNNMGVKVNNGSTTYSCVGVPCNSAAHLDSVRLVKSQTTIRGRSVQEILQTGENSLQAVMNAREQEKVDKKLVKVADEYVIMFPTDLSAGSANASKQATQDKAQEITAPLTVPNTINDGKLFKKLSISRSSINKTLVQTEGDVNPCGLARLKSDPSVPSQGTFNSESNVVDEKGNIKKSEIAAAPLNLVTHSFPAGADVMNIINQIMVRSEYAEAALNQPPDGNGMRPWWRIDVQTYHVAVDDNLKTTGSLPKLYVYRVVPYLVHSSRFLAPNATAPKLEELKKQAPKVYNYIYTGKNTEILGFDIDVSNTFYQVFAADNFTTYGDGIVSNKQGSSETNKPGTDPARQAAPSAPQGNDPAVGAMGTMMKHVGRIFSLDNKGGSAGESQATRVAKMFHDAILNGMDMMNISMDIVGDPFYIANSGMGNFSSPQTSLINVTKDGQVNYQNGEVDIIINFRTPTDLDQITGTYKLKNTKLAQEFSGLYKLTTITSKFRNGKFTQSIQGFRRTGQSNLEPADPKNIVTAKAEPPNP